MEFTTIEWIYLVVCLVFAGITWTMHRQWKMEQRWRKEDADACRMDIRSWQDKFDNERAARIEFAALNTELTLNRDGLAKVLVVFGDVYREVEKAKLNTNNLQGCICEMAGDGIKPLTDIKFVELGHYQIAASLTKHLAE